MPGAFSFIVLGNSVVDLQQRKKYNSRHASLKKWATVGVFLLVAFVCWLVACGASGNQCGLMAVAGSSLGLAVLRAFCWDAVLLMVDTIRRKR